MFRHLFTIALGGAVWAVLLGPAFAQTCGKERGAKYDELYLLPSATTGPYSTFLIRIQGHAYPNKPRMYPATSSAEVGMVQKSFLNDYNTMFVVTQATFDSISKLVCPNSLPPFEAPYPHGYFYDVLFVLDGQVLGSDDTRVLSDVGFREIYSTARNSVQTGAGAKP